MTDDYSNYCEERTNPRMLKCPDCATVFLGATGNWFDDPDLGEVFVPCCTCNGRGEVSSQYWDDVD